MVGSDDAGRWTTNVNGYAMFGAGILIKQNMAL